MDKLPLVFRNVYDLGRNYEEKLSFIDLEIRLEVFNLQKGYGF